MLAVVPGALPLAAIDPKVAPLVIGLAAGFVIGGFGHLIKSRKLIALGIAVIFLATVLTPVLFLDRSCPPGLPSGLC